MYLTCDCNCVERPFTAASCSYLSFYAVKELLNIANAHNYRNALILLKKLFYKTKKKL